MEMGNYLVNQKEVAVIGYFQCHRLIYKLGRGRERPPCERARLKERDGPRITDVTGHGVITLTALGD